MTAARWCDRCNAYREPHTHLDRPSLFDGLDAAEGTRLRDEAIEQVEEHAEPDLKAELLAAVRRVARGRAFLTSDDVWVDFRARSSDAPHEPRVLGAVMRAAAKLGWIEPTDDFRLSERPETHRNPKRVWRSLCEGVA